MLSPHERSRTVHLAEDGKLEPSLACPTAKNLRLARLHDLGLVVFDVIVAAQVQKAMDEKDAQLAFEGGAELLGLPLGDVDRDDHVSELEGHPRDFIALSAHLIVESVAFERKNVSGTGLSAEFPVETGHLIVVTGDLTQRDLPGSRSGLADAERVLGDIDDVSLCRLSGKDVVRHSLVAAIVAAYDRADA